MNSYSVADFAAQLVSVGAAALPYLGAGVAGLAVFAGVGIGISKALDFAAGIAADRPVLGYNPNASGGDPYSDPSREWADPYSDVPANDSARDPDRPDNGSRWR